MIHLELVDTLEESDDEGVDLGDVLGHQRFFGAFEVVQDDLPHECDDAILPPIHGDVVEMVGDVLLQSRKV